jgi:hypothetical protein
VFTLGCFLTASVCRAIDKRLGTSAVCFGFIVVVCVGAVMRHPHQNRIQDSQERTKGITMNIDKELLEMALVGYEAKAKAIQTRITEIRPLLGESVTIQTPVGEIDKRLTEDGKARIVAANRKRWALYRQQHGTQTTQTAQQPPKKRQLSAAQLQAMRLNAAKARKAAAKARKNTKVYQMKKTA